jgi:hypothetical protein
MTPRRRRQILRLHRRMMAVDRLHGVFGMAMESFYRWVTAAVNWWLRKRTRGLTDEERGLLLDLQIRRLDADHDRAVAALMSSVADGGDAGEKQTNGSLH